MGSHPINLVIRFLLEVIALVTAGLWGWNQIDGIMGIILALAIPILMATVWGVFAVPDDPSRSGKTIVKTNGILRLFIELGFFVFSIWCLKNLGYPSLSLSFGIIVFLHYLISFDRVRWLLMK